ncbi:hypothetical protein V8G54_011700 [Vigna mungo]|uniref:Integrase catalytic domain-containing protein n=1 Tax=Vigna mungo TaxID=3915 RepID=A0AAQ3S3A7_VIGMU
MDNHFVIVIDQKSLKFLTDQRLLTEQQFKGDSKLIVYDFEIRFRPGKENQVVDAMSRRQYFMVVSLFQTDEWETWEAEVQLDPKLVSLIQELLLNPRAHEGYELKKGRLFYHGTLVLPKNFSRITGIIKELHESPLGGHNGGSLLGRDKQDIKDMPMQQNRDIGPCRSFTTTTHFYVGKDAILVVVDQLTKYAYFVALAHLFTAIQVAHLFIKEVVKLHGFPSTIVYDLDKFQTEVVNHCLETYLRCMTGSQPKKWPQWLP